MKKLVLVLVLIGAAVGAWFATLPEHQTEVGPELTQLPTAKKPLRPIKKSLNEKITHKATAQTPDALSACDALSERLALMTLDEMNDSVETLEIEKDCRSALEKNLQPVLKQLLASCKAGEQFDKKACEQFFSLMRARAIAKLMDKNVPISKWTESELMNTILWQFVQDAHPSENNLAANLKLIDELLARVPDSYAASKAKFVHLLLQELIHKNMSGADALEATWKDLMQYGAEESLQYFPILKPMMRGDTAAFNNQVKKWQRENPQDPMGYYYGAYSAWKSKDRGATVRSLEKALSLSPNNEQIKKSLAAARKGRFNDPIFTLNFGFSFDNI